MYVGTIEPVQKNMPPKSIPKSVYEKRRPSVKGAG